MKARMLSLFLVLIMLFGMVPAYAVDADDTNIGEAASTVTSNSEPESPQNGNEASDPSTDEAGDTAVSNTELAETQNEYEARVSKDWGKTWYNYRTLASAIDYIKTTDTGPYTQKIVELLKDVEVSAEINVSNKVFTLRSSTRAEEGGQQFTIKRGSGYLGYLIAGSNTVMGLSNLVIDGGAVWTGPEDPILNRGTVNSGVEAGASLIAITGDSSLYVQDGTIFQNNQTRGGGGGAIFVNMNKGLVDIRDGTIIRNCSASSDTGKGSAIYFECHAQGDQTADLKFSGTVQITGCSSNDTGAIYMKGRVPTSSDFVSQLPHSLGYFAGDLSIVGNVGGGLHYFNSKARVYIEGNVRITGNVDVHGSTLNVDLRQIQSQTNFILNADFTGSIGVTMWATTEKDPKFGLRSDEQTKGAENIFKDSDPNVTAGCYSTDPRMLRWIDTQGKAARMSTDGGQSWDYYETLAEAIGAVTTTGTTETNIVELLQDIEINKQIPVAGSTKFTLRSGSQNANGGEIYTVKRASGSLGEQDPSQAGSSTTGMFYLGTNSNVKVENLIVDGNKQAADGVSSRLFRLNTATLTLGNGAVLQNNNWAEGNGSGAVYLRNTSTLIMEDGSVIRDNVGTYGAAVTLYDKTDKMIMYGGTITGNEATGRALDKLAGTIYTNGASLTMTGGSITGNTSKGGKEFCAGVVAYNPDGKIILSGDAQITGNTEAGGSASNLWLKGQNQLTLNGNFTGSVSIDDKWTGANNENGEKFGISSGGYTGAENFTNDATDKNLIGSTQEGQLVWSQAPVAPVAQIIGGSQDGKSFSTLGEAIRNYADDSQYIKMISDSSEGTINVEKTVYVDLAGFTVTADVTVKEGAVYYGFDTTTNGYTNADKNYGKIVGQVTGSMSNITQTSKEQTSVAMSYLKVTDGAETSFHRFDMQLTYVVFRPSEAGLYFKSEFYGNEVVKQAIQEASQSDLTYGLFVGDNEAIGPTSNNAAAHDPEQFAVGAEGDKHQGSMVTNIVKEDATDNSIRTETPIYAGTYFNFKDAGEVKGTVKFVTLSDVVRRTIGRYNGGYLQNAQERAFEQFWKKFGSLYRGFNVQPNIPAE